MAPARSPSWFTRFASRASRATARPAAFAAALSLVRDSEALHIKLDELIRATRGARNELLDLEELDEELRRIMRRYERLAAGARQRLRG